MNDLLCAVDFGDSPSIEQVFRHFEDLADFLAEKFLLCILLEK
jgi:hypothetical protein